MVHSEYSFIDDVSIVLAGAAGQGIQSVETILVSLFKKSNYHVFASKEYMSRVRGGVNSIEIRVSSKPVSAFINRIDFFVPLSKEALERKFLKSRLTNHSVIIGEKGVLGETTSDLYFIDIPFTQLALESGNKIYSNVVAAGVFACFFKIPFTLIREYIENFFKGKEVKIISENVQAAKKGYEYAHTLLNEGKLAISLSSDSAVTDQIILNGADSIALGAIAGGCNFISSYPMSPSTGVLMFLAKHALDFDIVVDQAEDEIAAINATIGAWYTGARGIVTTSGGGFALMTEGISLSGITETPVVVHLAQRPGPGTGLPTRTEQGDLNLVLYAGHGDFIRAIFAPATIQDGIELTQLAFNFADKFQIPVFVLTDQYFVDTYYNTPMFDIQKNVVEKHIIETQEDYNRYTFTDTGITPRGIPGFGKGFVAVDSDEHDELGRITEDHDIREKMVEKRFFKKKKLVKEAVILPTFVGSSSYDTLIVSWGTTYSSISESLGRLNDPTIAHLHYKQVFPLHPLTEEWLRKAKKVVVIENNVTGQFADLIQQELNISLSHRILKFDGLMFTVEELVERIKEEKIQEVLK